MLYVMSKLFLVIIALLCSINLHAAHRFKPLYGATLQPQNVSTLHQNFKLAIKVLRTESSKDQSALLCANVLTDHGKETFSRVALIAYACIMGIEPEESHIFSLEIIQEAYQELCSQEKSVKSAALLRSGYILLKLLSTMVTPDRKSVV